MSSVQVDDVETSSASSGRLSGVSLVAVLAAGAMGTRILVPGGLTVAVVVAIALLPVWWSALHQYRFARTVIALGLLAILWGIALTLLDSSRDSSPSMLRQESATLFAIIGGIGVLLWARSVAGSVMTAVAFGGGMLATVVLNGGNPDNIWKYSLAVPAAVVLLGLAAARRNRIVELGFLAVLAGVSLVSDSRGMTTFLLIAFAVILVQTLGVRRDGPRRPWRSILMLVALGAAAYNLVQLLILEGVLGDAAAQRSKIQIDAAGSLITGGRPEIGAAVALIAAKPLGYGAGTSPLSNDVWLAKSGMNGLSYLPDEGYVNAYMFGGHFEVHSVLGDIWIRFGPIGAGFCLLLIGMALYGVARAASARAVSALAVFLVVLGMWDTLFSPLLTSNRTLALMFALAAIPAVARSTSTGRPILPRRINSTLDPPHAVPRATPPPSPLPGTPSASHGRLP